MNETKRPVTVLALIASAADRKALRTIFRHSRWVLRFADTLTEARAVLRDGEIGVVISDYAFSNGRSWADFLRAVQKMLAAPPVVVTDRVTDDRLWAEVLNMGGYDVLPQPFEAEEVFRVVSLAWRAWRSRVERLQPPPLPVTPKQARHQMRAASAGR